jgi:CheY-like chemotaxis protein
LGALSYALQSAPGVVTVSAAAVAPVDTAGDAAAEVSLAWQPRDDARPPASLLAAARTLTQAIGGVLGEQAPAREQVLRLRLPMSVPPTVVVIDDNEGLLALFQRYLAEAGWRVLGAATAAEGLRLSREARPRAIVLDILMPGTDGWVMLDRLKHDPATALVPVIVCSVFNDPRLATALGAAAFLPKPVTRAALLEALNPRIAQTDTENRNRGTAVRRE